MGDTRADQLDDDTDDLLDELDEGTADDDTDADDVDADADADDDADDEPDDEAEKAFLAKLDDDGKKHYRIVKARAAKANADAGRQRRKLRRLTAAGPAKTDPPKPTPPKTKSTSGGEVVDKATLLAELRAEMETKAQQDRVVGLAERKLESMLSLPADADARERKLNRAIKMLDLTGCTSAADVADAIADLKDDAPELFKRQRKAKPKTGGVGGPVKATGAGAKAPDKIGALFED